MTQKWFTQQACAIVRNILAGGWSHELPIWADYERRHEIRYVRAVRAAECYILMAQTWNKRFNVDAFIRECGLKEGA